MAALHSRFWRNLRLRFEREDGSRIVDVYGPSSPEPTTVGISDLRIIGGQIDAVLREFDAEEACRNAQHGVVVGPLRVADGGRH